MEKSQIDEELQVFGTDRYVFIGSSVFTGTYSMRQRAEFSLP
jgi:hypothetical protein